MYVNQRSGFDLVSDPYAGEFGAEGGPSLSPNNPFEQSGFSVDSLISALTPCGITALLNPAGAADCAWNALRGVIEISADLPAILTTIIASDCTTALTALGLPIEVTSIVSAIPTIGAVWSAFQAKARSELSRLQGAVAQVTYRETYDRGRDRTAAEGGGHTLVDASGTETGVWCPGYVQNIAYDANGDVAVLVMEMPKDYPVGTRCPQDMKPRASTPTPVPGLDWSRVKAKIFREPKVPLVRFVSKTDNGGAVVTKPWYKNKWVWIGAAVVLAVGGTAVVVVGRSR